MKMRPTKLERKEEKFERDKRRRREESRRDLPSALGRTSEESCGVARGEAFLLRGSRWTFYEMSFGGLEGRDALQLRPFAFPVASSNFDAFGLPPSSLERTRTRS